MNYLLQSHFANQLHAQDEFAQLQEILGLCPRQIFFGQISELLLQNQVQLPYKINKRDCSIQFKLLSPLYAGAG